MRVLFIPVLFQQLTYVHSVDGQPFDIAILYRHAAEVGVDDPHTIMTSRKRQSFNMAEVNVDPFMSASLTSSCTWVFFTLIGSIEFFFKSNREKGFGRGAKRSFQGGDYASSLNLSYAIKIAMASVIRLVATFLGSFLFICMGAAKTMMTAKQTAATGVNTRAIPNHQGNRMPMAPAISATPMKRMKGIGSPSTPVCPFSCTSAASDNVDLQKPE